MVIAFILSCGDFKSESRPPPSEESVLTEGFGVIARLLCRRLRLSHHS